MSDATRDRYTATDREHAYTVYRDEAKRSLRKTAELTGVPFGTLATWSRVDGWQLRLRQDDDRALDIVRQHTWMTLQGKVPELAEHAYDLATNAKDERVQSDATFKLLAILGYVPEQRSSVTVNPGSDQPATPLAGKSATELADLLAGRILPEVIPDPE